MSLTIATKTPDPIKSQATLWNFQNFFDRRFTVGKFSANQLLLISERPAEYITFVTDGKMKTKNAEYSHFMFKHSITLDIQFFRKRENQF